MHDDGSVTVHVPTKELSENPKTTEDEQMKRLGSTMTIAMMSAFACELAMKAIVLPSWTKPGSVTTLWQLYRDLPEDSRAADGRGFPGNRFSTEEGAPHFLQVAILRSECGRSRHQRR